MPRRFSPGEKSPIGFLYGEEGLSIILRQVTNNDFGEMVAPTSGTFYIYDSGDSLVSTVVADSLDIGRMSGRVSGLTEGNYTVKSSYVYDGVTREIVSKLWVASKNAGYLADARAGVGGQYVIIGDSNLASLVKELYDEGLVNDNFKLRIKIKFLEFVAADFEKTKAWGKMQGSSDPASTLSQRLAVLEKRLVKDNVSIGIVDTGDVEW